MMKRIKYIYGIWNGARFLSRDDGTKLKGTKTEMWKLRRKLLADGSHNISVMRM